MDDIETIKNNNTNREYILDIVKQKGAYLEWASPELQDDKELVLEALKQDGGALEFASNRLKDDKDILMQALEKTRVGSMLCK